MPSVLSVIREFLPPPSEKPDIPSLFEAQAFISVRSIFSYFFVFSESFLKTLSDGSNATAFFMSGKDERASSIVSPLKAPRSIYAPYPPERYSEKSGESLSVF